VIVITLARKPPPKGTPMAQNATQWGCAGLNIGGCRVGTEVRFSAPATPNKGTFNASFAAEYKGKQVTGRWPANLILEHLPDCSCEPKDNAGYCNSSTPMGYCSADCPVLLLDNQSGIRTSGLMAVTTVRHSISMFGQGNGPPTTSGTFGDTGGASRFFKQIRGTE